MTRALDKKLARNDPVLFDCAVFGQDIAKVMSGAAAGPAQVEQTGQPQVSASNLNRGAAPALQVELEVSRMYRTLRILLCFGAALLFIAIDASAEVYRWVDERGVVNYGSRPPAGSKAKPVESDNGRVSVVPAPAKPAAAAPGSAEQTALRERVGRLESQLEDERRQRALTQAAESERLARARADCEAQRRLNCDTDPYAQYEPGVIVGPLRRPPVFKPRHPPGQRPPQAGYDREPPAPMNSRIPYRR